MSDSEETRPGASSALLNIASAYSDSDSSQDYSEDCSTQKSLGSLVENLRAEAKKSEIDVTKGCETETRVTPTVFEPEKTQSVTKIVRLDSGKVVKIRTSPGTKAPEIKHEESHFKSGNSLTEAVVDSSPRPVIPTVNTEILNAEIQEASDSYSRPQIHSEVKTDLAISNDLEKKVAHDEGSSFGVNVNVSNVVNHPRVHNADSINVDNLNTMGIRSTKEEVKPDDDDIIVESSNVPESVPPPPVEKPEIEISETPHEPSKTWVSGSSSVVTSEQDDDIQEITPVTTAQPEANIQKSAYVEPKTESTILNAYLTSRQIPRKEENTQNAAVVTRNFEMKRTPDIIFRGTHFERGNTEKSAAAGSVAGVNVAETAKTGESLHGFNPDEGLVSKLDIYEVKPRPELKPLPKLERLRMKSPVAGPEHLLKKTDKELQASSPALYKMLESCESAAVPEIKKGPAPIKLKRNFSCLSTTGSVQPEKKFIPEPSEAARITPSDSEMSSDVPAVPAIPEITIIPAEPRPQEEELMMKSPPRIQIPSPSRSPVSPNFQQVSPQSYQPSFTNMINTSPNQVPSFQSMKKSPQPVTPQQRVSTRRDEQKRTLPLILRKADISGAKARECHRVDEIPAKPPKKDDLTITKMTSEGEISIETISSESQEQSASVPFSNSSSNQENSNFATSVNFENVIEATSKEPETPLSDDAGSDNARPPPTPTKDDTDDKQQTSFLSQPDESGEMPTIIIPKKRGRPRKFPLPESPTLVGTWPTPDKNGKSASKSVKKKKPAKKPKVVPVEPETIDEDDKSKKRYIPRYKKKTSNKSTGGEEQEVTRTFNKKGRMEVMTEGCKPVTVNQITEYFWPPVSTLPPGEKPEGLMIQEQISEYLGVKSFKRKYPSIKRRAVDMEERNYLQENGFVSENMCDLGLTAVYSADIMEIMYNDFPHKFDEYRRYTREKKMKEQKALREKQAAENMDPRKEALESIVSWNTEFNSTRNNRRGGNNTRIDGKRQENHERIGRVNTYLISIRNH